MIATLRPGLAEIGKIKIGGKGEVNRSGNRTPVKFDHFVVTTLERDAKGDLVRDASVHSVVGDSPTELDVMLLYNDPDVNFHTELGYWEGQKCICRGDGIKASRFVPDASIKAGGYWADRPCPCELLETNPPKCKPHGRLSCALRGATFAGGMHVFRTTSWNTCQFLTESIRFLSATMGGKIAGVPLTLKVMSKTTMVNGKSTKIYVVGLFFKGDPVQMIEAAIQAEEQRARLRIDLASIEKKTLAELKALPMLPDGGDFDMDQPPAPAAAPAPVTAAVSDLADALSQADQTASLPEPKQIIEQTPASAQTQTAPEPEPEPARTDQAVDPEPIRVAILAEYTRMNYNQAKRTLSLKNILTKLAPQQALRPLSQVDDPTVLQKVLDQLQGKGA